jgi:uncharacterized membrane protein YkvA (DUF1232 family)
MANLIYYLLLLILIVYILSPLDAHPLFLDDLIASGILFYLLYKNAKQKKQQQQYHSSSRSRSGENKTNKSHGPLTLEEAYRLLGADRGASWEEINKAYKEKMRKSHPDKVSHLGEELQEKAKEIALKLNEALEMIKRSKGK